MTDIVISAESVGKKYLIGHNGDDIGRYTALRDVIGRYLKSLGRSTIDLARGQQLIYGDDVEEFWALKNVNFEIKRGEVVGIIGRNGAGKSTLLKVLSRITEPSEGRILIRGRLASLLEVGTGFHPELTGRENIFLNGAILGMTRAEIKHKFEEIVAFAEVERFLDTPVKRYSSGMYVRLAFAVAAHLEPEILVVDEVLAVGDANFQKKCLGKMQEVAGLGRTVLFVSHNMNAVANLTKRVIVLSEGSIIGDGATQEGVELYQSAAKVSMRDKAVGRGRVATKSIDVFGASRDRPPRTGERCHFELRLVCNQSSNDVRVAIGVDDAFSRRIFTLDSSKYDLSFNLNEGEHTIVCAIDSLNLLEGDYRLHVYVGNQFEVYDYRDADLSFEVMSGAFFPGAYSDPAHGPVLIPHLWINRKDGDRE